jgi:anaerobic magnesium-protoporphyrin IX monomethyl ester cyclase
MARVLLIKCGDYSPWRIGNTVSPPLGLMYLAAYARRERPGKHVFRLVDEHTQAWSPTQWLNLVDDFRPDVIALSALTVEASFLKGLAGLFKSNVPHIPLIAGGPHATAIRTALLDEARVDYVVGGEAEIAFIELLDALERGDREPSGRISGLCYRRSDGELFEVPNNVAQPAINDLPMPAYDLIDFATYANFARMAPYARGRYAGLFTSRGCPYRCTYCHEVFEKGFRAMTPSRVVDEMQHIVETYGVRQFEFYDDIFNADPKRAVAICREIVRRDLRPQLYFPNGLRADRLPDELVHALREAGTVMISFAIETSSARLQKLIRKHMRLDLLVNAVTLAERLRILCFGFFMLGFPTETRAEACATIEFARALPLHGGMFFIPVPYVGTEMHRDLAAQHGTHDAPDLSLAGMLAAPTLESDPNYTSSTLSTMSAQELKRLQRWAYFRFYSQPARIRRLLRDAPLDPDFVFRGLRIARFIAGSLPGAGRLERAWRSMRSLPAAATALNGERAQA